MGDPNATPAATTGAGTNAGAGAGSGAAPAAAGGAVTSPTIQCDKAAAPADNKDGFPYWMRHAIGLGRTSGGWVNGFEGGFVDDPNDPGGATNHGVTFTVFQSAITKGIVSGYSATVPSLKTLTKEDAAKIAKSVFWNVVSKPIKEPRLQMIMSELKWAGVTYGIFNKWMQGYCNQRVGSSLTADGYPGPASYKVYNSLSKQIVDEIVDNFAPSVIAGLKTLKYKGKSQFDTYGLGWSRRVVVYQKILDAFPTATDPSITDSCLDASGWKMTQIDDFLATKGKLHK